MEKFFNVLGHGGWIFFSFQVSNYLYYDTSYVCQAVFLTHWKFSLPDALIPRFEIILYIFWLSEFSTKGQAAVLLFCVKSRLTFSWWYLIQYIFLQSSCIWKDRLLETIIGKRKRMVLILFLSQKINTIGCSHWQIFILEEAKNIYTSTTEPSKLQTLLTYFTYISSD